MRIQKPQTDAQLSHPSEDQRIAEYVLASGQNAGQTIPVMVMEQHEYPEGLRANLAKVDSASLRYQTLALYSEGKEPGTWHWA